MFTHILIPTDGSPVADKAVKAGLELAKALNAKVTGYYAIEVVQPQIYGEGYMVDQRLVQEFERTAQEAGEKCMAAIAKQAGALGVEFSSVVAKAETPYEGIIDTAKKKKCDAIFMASHGRRGLASLIMGSVTQKVLTHSKLPVLVYR